MSPSRPIEPVLHCTSREFDKVYNLGVKLLNEGVYYNTVTFPAVPVLQVDFETDNNKLRDLIAVAKGNTDKTDERNAQSIEVHKLLKSILNYAKAVCGDDIEKINLSGFDPSDDPTPHSKAPQAVIKRIEKYSEPHSVKVMLEPAEGLESEKQEVRTYVVRVFNYMETEEYREGCSTTDSRELIVRNVPYLMAQYYAVIIINAAGANELSGKLKFTLTDD